MDLPSRGVNLEKLARVTLAKVWANFFRGKNSKWPPAAILKSTFPTIWATFPINMFPGVSRAEEFIAAIVFMI